MDSAGLHVIQKTDQKKARDVLFESFRSDPFFKYLLGDSSDDALVAGPIQEFILTIGTRYGEVYAPSQEIEGVAVWLPPHNAQITAWKSLRCGVLRMRGSFPDRLKGPVWRKMLQFSGFSDEIYERHLRFPHWYLLAIGIADAYRGKGYATRLVNPLLDRIDRDRLPCYLETHNERNVPLYRHFGFDVIEVSYLPGSEQNQWSMLRQPGG